MRCRTRIFIVIAMLFVAIGGMALVAYPFVAAEYNARFHSDVVSEYEQQVHQSNDAKINAALQAAHAYNGALFRGEINGADPQSTNYYELLDPTGNGIMAYVEIPKIDVRIPIYHGTSDAVLDKGAGHMPPTSLPVGGENTHAAISAHTGMASNPMFTDLELLEIGDLFYLHVLGSTLCYEVETINVVDPNNISLLKIQPGRDMVTLITCTPYGVNTHRLLVTGQRTEIQAEVETVPSSTGNTQQETRSIWNEKYLEGIILGLKLSVIPVVFLVVILIITRKKNAKT